MSSTAIIATLSVNVFSWMLIGFLSIQLLKIPLRHVRTLLKRGYIGFFLPILIGRNILTHINRDDVSSLIYLAFGALIMVSFSCLVSWIIAKKSRLPGSQQKTFILMTGFHNYALMAFPVIQSMFPAKYLALLFFFTFVCDALFWSLGVFILQKPSLNKIPWRDIFNPPFTAILFCLPLALIVDFSLSPIIIQLTSIPAKIALPFGLVCFGAILQPALKGLRLKDMAVPSLWYSYLLRTLVFPVFWILCIWLTVSSEPVSKILLIEAVMPASIGVIALVSIYGGDEKLISLFCLSSNIFSAVTLPFYIWILFTFKLL